MGVKDRIANVQFTVPERLDNKEDPKRDTWVFLRRGSRKDLLSKMGAGLGEWRDWN